MEVMDDSFVPPFEGPEKLFEIWFAPDKQKEVNKQTYGLRTVPRSSWEEVLARVKCKIINVIKNEHLDAYLLSESSMFVWNYKLILKTCGTTTLLLALPKIIEVAKSVGLEHVDNVFYSRKKYLYPSKQDAVHSKFSNEVEFLNNIFADGSAYALGPIDDNWNLYITHTKTEEGDGEDESPRDDDRTLEILMHELDPAAMIPFFKSEKFSTAEDSTKLSGIADFFPNAEVDAFLFDPCGYSLNGILGAHYFTIHITPQKLCSYVSFETNIPLDNYDALVDSVLKVFRPGKYTISFFSNESETNELTKQRLNWRRNDEGIVYGAKMFYKFDDYNLTFVHGKKGAKTPKTRHAHVKLANQTT